MAIWYIFVIDIFSSTVKNWEFCSLAIGVHAARFAALELQDDVEFASILLSAAVIVLLPCIIGKSAILKIVVCVCVCVQKHAHYLIKIYSEMEWW